MSKEKKSWRINIPVDLACYSPSFYTDHFSIYVCTISTTMTRVYVYTRSKSSWNFAGGRAVKSEDVQYVYSYGCERDLLIFFFSSSSSLGFIPLYAVEVVLIAAGYCYRHMRCVSTRSSSSIELYLSARSSPTIAVYYMCSYTGWPINSCTLCSLGSVALAVSYTHLTLPTIYSV